MFAEIINDVPTAAAWHAEVDNCGVEDVLLNGFDGGTGGLANGGVMAHSRKLRPHQIGDGLFVIDKQNSQAVSFFSAHCRLRGDRFQLRAARVFVLERLCEREFRGILLQILKKGSGTNSAKHPLGHLAIGS